MTRLGFAILVTTTWTVVALGVASLGPGAVGLAVTAYAVGAVSLGRLLGMRWHQAAVNIACGVPLLVWATGATVVWHARDALRRAK